MSLFTKAHIDQLKKAANVHLNISVTIIKSGDSIEIHSQDPEALTRIADYLKRILNIRRAGDYQSPQAKVIKTYGDDGRLPHLALKKDWQSGQGKPQEDEIEKLYSHLDRLLEQEVKNYLDSYLREKNAIDSPPRFIYHRFPRNNEIVITSGGTPTTYNAPKRNVLATPGYDVDQKSYDEPLRSLLIYFSKALQQNPSAEEITYCSNLQASAVAANPPGGYRAPPPPRPPQANAPGVSRQPPQNLCDPLQQTKLGQQQVWDAQRRREAFEAQQQQQVLAAPPPPTVLAPPPPQQPVWTAPPPPPQQAPSKLPVQPTTLPPANAAPSVLPPPPSRPLAVTPSVSARTAAISSAASVSTSTTTSSSQSQWMSEADMWESLHNRNITHISIATEHTSGNRFVWLTFKSIGNRNHFYQILQPLIILEESRVETKSDFILSFTSSWLLSLPADSVATQGLKDIRQFCENYCRNARVIGQSFPVAAHRAPSTTSAPTSSTGSTVPPAAPLPTAITTSSTAAASASSQPVMPQPQPAAATTVASVAATASPPPQPIAPQRPSVEASSSVYAPAQIAPAPIAPAASSSQPPATTEADMWGMLKNKEIVQVSFANKPNANADSLENLCVKVTFANANALGDNEDFIPIEWVARDYDMTQLCAFYSLQSLRNCQTHDTLKNLPEEIQQFYHLYIKDKSNTELAPVSFVVEAEIARTRPQTGPAPG